MNRRGGLGAPVLLGLLAGAGHLLYPAWLALRTRRLPVPVAPPDPPAWPAVTAVVPAYKEAGVIAAKVADLRANRYPGPLEVLVVADGDPETAARAEEAGARVLAPPQRLGKAQALNMAMAQVEHPVVVLSDANNRLVPGSLAALVRHLGDPRVAAVAGDKIEPEAGESAYWRFEGWLKAREWRSGTTIGFIGELGALRTSAWRPIPDDVATDDLWLALDLNGRGERIAYEPAARAEEPVAATRRQQWERRTRSVAGALHIFRRRAWQLGPRGGSVAVQIWGHRLGRYTVSPAAHLLLVGWALHHRQRPAARLVLGGHLLAVVPTLARRAGWTSPPAVLAVPEQALLLQAVAVGGVIRYLRGDRRTQWPRVER